MPLYPLSRYRETLLVAMKPVRTNGSTHASQGILPVNLINLFSLNLFSDLLLISEAGPWSPYLNFEYVALSTGFSNEP